MCVRSGRRTFARSGITLPKKVTDARPMHNDCIEVKDFLFLGHFINQHEKLHRRHTKILQFNPIILICYWIKRVINRNVLTLAVTHNSKLTCIPFILFLPDHTILKLKQKNLVTRETRFKRKGLFLFCVFMPSH